MCRSSRCAGSTVHPSSSALPRIVLRMASMRSTERRNVMTPCHRGLGLGHGGNDLVGEIIDEGDEEVPGTHGGVADFKIEELLGGIDALQDAKALVFGLRTGSLLLSRDTKRVYPL